MKSFAAVFLTFITATLLSHTAYAQAGIASGVDDPGIVEQTGKSVPATGVDAKPETGGIKPIPGATGGIKPIPSVVDVPVKLPPVVEGGQVSGGSFAAPDKVFLLSLPQELRLIVAGPAQLAQASSNLALVKADNDLTKTFAQSELNQKTQIGQLLTPFQSETGADNQFPNNPRLKLALDQLQAVPKGPAFDRAYLSMQIETLEQLRMNLQSYQNKTSVGVDIKPNDVSRNFVSNLLSSLKEQIVSARALSTKLRT